MFSSEHIVKPIYMDHHATTPVDSRVLQEMLPYFTEIYGNAASIDHDFGSAAKQAVDRAREEIARALNCSPDEIIFTSGATEANNLALLGVAERNADKGRHIISCVTEHKAILDSCQYLETKGWEVTYVRVDSMGLIDPDDVRSAIRKDTILISIMSANNEIGTIAPISEIGHLAATNGIVFHTDATQAVGYLPIDVDSMNIHLLSLSAHKIYGPKGVGALYVRKTRPRVRVGAIIHGGGHERGMRSGTLNVPGIVGLAKAVRIARDEMDHHPKRMQALRDHLWSLLRDLIPDIQLNGDPVKRLPHNLSVSIPGVESRSLVTRLHDRIAVSTGSACTTAKVEPSHVILALGFGEDRAHSSLRFGLGRQNTELEVMTVSEIIAETVRQLRKLIVP